jgi:hypothetical protein
LILIIIILLPIMYLTVGRFFLDALLRSKTIYGLTKDRIIIRSGIFKSTTTLHYIHEIPEIKLRKELLKRETILLGNSNVQSFLNEGTPWFWQRITPRLEFIDDAKTVLEKIREMQQSQLTPPNNAS